MVKKHFSLGHIFYPDFLENLKESLKCIILKLASKLIIFHQINKNFTKNYKSSPN